MCSAMGLTYNIDGCSVQSTLNHLDKRSVNEELPLWSSG